MAKKARKRSAVKARKAKRAKAKTKTKVRTKAKSRTSVKKTSAKRAAVKKKPARKSRRKAQPKGIADRVSGAFQTVVDTIQETEALRNKMEPPGTSETS